MGNREVYIVDGVRTPFLKSRRGPNPFSSADLAVLAAKSLLLRQSFAPTAVEEVVIGSTVPNPNEPNIARIIGLRAGCGDHVPAMTVMRNCASGLQALDTARMHIERGDANLVLAGGTDAMSQSPLLLNPPMTAWFAQFASAKTLGEKLSLLTRLRPGFFVPVVALLKGLSDPIVGINMGQTAENLAYDFKITRAEMDAFAVQSQQRAAQAQKEARFDEITPICDYKGQFFTQDDGVRADTSVEKLAKLPPFFDKKYGQVTAGNSSQITDGAAVLILASEAAVTQHQLPVLGKIVDCAWAGLDPAVMGLGPAYSIAALLKKTGLSIADIDYFEINEAFAAQVIACLRALADEDFCKTRLGWDRAVGEIPMDRLNIDGGAIALGHPVGASGARIALHALHVLKRTGGKRAIVSLCIGGGQGGAMLLESV